MFLNWWVWLGCVLCLALLSSLIAPGQTACAEKCGANIIAPPPKLPLSPVSGKRLVQQSVFTLQSVLPPWGEGICLIHSACDMLWFLQMTEVTSVKMELCFQRGQIHLLKQRDLEFLFHNIKSECFHKLFILYSCFHEASVGVQAAEGRTLRQVWGRSDPEESCLSQGFTN